MPIRTTVDFFIALAVGLKYTIGLLRHQVLIFAEKLRTADHCGRQRPYLSASTLTYTNKKLIFIQLIEIESK